MSRSRMITTAALAIACALPAAPVAARTISCGTARDVGKGASVTRVTTTYGSCREARGVARSFARTRVSPRRFACTETFTAAKRVRVRCNGKGRTIRFRVAWSGALPVPPLAQSPAS